MKTYVTDEGTVVVPAGIISEGPEPYLTTANDPCLEVGTTLREEGNQDGPRLRVSAPAHPTAEGNWHTPLETLMQEFCVRYSFITFTHSTIAGSMAQEAATREEAIDKVRAWLTLIYQPVEFDYVTV